ncbi:ABC transporter ATP-binding protein [Paraliobacillus sp. JSM ZJ581]|uniref:ABC transporter ATP-binding protein n=1 Tax=Paraliobacillus sp. JSM ZJ581 TaxID=3342118 RepID=UPI0035A87BB7
MDYALQISNLSKSYNGIEVVSNVNMKVKREEIYGMIGPNGSGKTTIMKMIMNLLKPTGGEIEVLGEKITSSSHTYLKKIGSMIEYPILYEDLTSIENLELHCKYMDIQDNHAVDEALELVSLKTGDKAVKHFSMGMKQRLGIARAIITKPELLILDEPINGLDPSGIKEMRSLLKRMTKEYKCTILISSHILNEIENIADTIGILKDGILIEEVGMDTIHNKNVEYIELVTNDAKKAAYILENELQLSNVKQMDQFTVLIYNSHSHQKEIVAKLISHHLEIEAINKRHNSLENHFLTTTSREEIR